MTGTDARKQFGVEWGRLSRDQKIRFLFEWARDNYGSYSRSEAHAELLSYYCGFDVSEDKLEMGRPSVHVPLNLMTDVQLLYEAESVYGLSGEVVDSEEFSKVLLIVRGVFSA